MHFMCKVITTINIMKIAKLEYVKLTEKVNTIQTTYDC